MSESKPCLSLCSSYLNGSFTICLLPFAVWNTKWSIGFFNYVSTSQFFDSDKSHFEVGIARSHTFQMCSLWFFIPCCLLFIYCSHSSVTKLMDSIYSWKILYITYYFLLITLNDKSYSPSNLRVLPDGSCLIHGFSSMMFARSSGISWTENMRDVALSGRLLSKWDRVNGCCSQTIKWITETEFIFEVKMFFRDCIISFTVNLTLCSFDTFYAKTA
jgi:hypothetical protein